MLSIRLLARPLLSVAVVLIAALSAQAETVVQDVTVTASVAAECQVSSAVLDFGEYRPDGGVHVSAPAQIYVDCNADDVPVIIGLDGGQHPQGGERRMVGGHGQFLRYNLYTEHPGIPWREVWGDGKGFGQPRATAFSSSNPYSTVHGQIPSGQQVPPGVYTDTVTITIEVNSGS